MKTAITPPKTSRAKAVGLATLAAAALTTSAAGFVTLAQAQQTNASSTVGSGSGIPLAQDAPDRYTVKQGDTLWDISKVFLRDPWYWPEIWFVNPQVKNPHLIFPGDVLVLVKGGAQPQVMIAERGPEGAAAEAQPSPEGTRGSTKLSPRIRSTPINSAVTTIPYDSVAAFLRRPTLMSDKEVKTGPYVVAFRDDHVIGGATQDIYGRGIKTAEENSRFNIIHVDEPLHDPDNNKILGYRAVYAGTAAVTGPGEPAKLNVQEASREILRGDKLFPEQVSAELDFLPRAPSNDVRGSIMAVAGVSVAGARDVVAINRGSRHGLESGHVLAILQKGDTVVDRFANGDSTGGGSSGGNVKLPDERIGLAMVFKTYDNMSYALIMEASRPVRTGDGVRTP